MNLPLAIALQSATSQHLGFLLLSPIDIGSGSCVFLVTPHDPELLDSSLFRLLESYDFREAGEHRYMVSTTESGYAIEIICDSLGQFEVTIAASGGGNFRAPGNPQVHGNVSFETHAA